MAEPTAGKSREDTKVRTRVCREKRDHDASQPCRDGGGGQGISVSYRRTRETALPL